MLWEAWARRVASGDSGECAAALEITPPVHNAQMQAAMIALRTHSSMTRNCDINVSYRKIHSLTTHYILENFPTSGIVRAIDDASLDKTLVVNQGKDVRCPALWWRVLADAPHEPNTPKTPRSECKEYSWAQFFPQRSDPWRSGPWRSGAAWT